MELQAWQRRCEVLSNFHYILVLKIFIGNFISSRYEKDQFNKKQILFRFSYTVSTVAGCKYLFVCLIVLVVLHCMSPSGEHRSMYKQFYYQQEVKKSVHQGNVTCCNLKTIPVDRRLCAKFTAPHARIIEDDVLCTPTVSAPSELAMVSTE